RCGRRRSPRCCSASSWRSRAQSHARCAACFAVRSGSLDRRNRDTTIRVAGLVLAIGYGVVVAWLYARQPQTMAQVTGGLAAAIGTYRIDELAFADGLRFF